MNRSTRPGKLLMLAVFLLSSIGLSAQTRTGPSVTAAGGVDAANGTTRLSGTIGQPIIGISATRIVAHQGFWVPQSAGTSSIDPVAGAPATGIPTLRCFPNPVSSTATVLLHLPDEGPVSLRLLDPLGREIRSLIDNEKRTGDAELPFNTNELPSGWYTLILSAGDQRASLPVRIVQ